jgi:hypothetical protein
MFYIRTSLMKNFKKRLKGKNVQGMCAPKRYKYRKLRHGKFGKENSVYDLKHSYLDYFPLTNQNFS